MVKILLSSLLTERQWSQEDLARETGIDISVISSLADEMPKSIDLRHLNAICEVLGCGVGDLMVSVPDCSDPHG